LIVALDFTETSDRMLPMVGGLAHRGDLPIRLVTTGSPTLEEYDLVDLSARARRVHGCPVTSIVIHDGDPADDLAEFAERHRGGLVCLASHGRTAIGELLFGSMAEDLLRRHVGPMFTIGPGVPDDYALGDNLLVAVDKSVLRTPLLAAAIRWAATFGGTVELFEAVTRGSSLVPIAPTEELRAARELIPTAALTVVESHDPVRAIGEAAMASGSVIAVATRARTGVERAVLGSVTAELLRWSSTPLLIVPA
jgi:nucleotide-binding universal stress UspA family protein